MEVVTVGHVSGFIAVAVVIVQLVLPTLLTLILSACLGSRNNAVTWSVAGRTLQSSYWPTILQTDGVASKGVKKRVVTLSWLNIIAVVLIAAAGIVTPLGLYDKVAPVGHPERPFEYSRDPGPFGYATPSRSELGLARRCGALTPKPCPGSTYPFRQTGNESVGSVEFPWGYDGRVPRERYGYLGGGLNKNSDTVSGPWDVEWRAYEYREDKTQDVPLNNGSRYLVGKYQVFENRVLDEKPSAIEGLVIDPKQNGIGFRNHTLPSDIDEGATWSEDLLFTTPETVCVPNNITLDFVIGNDNDTQKKISDLKITDRGGFVNIDQKYIPWINGSQGQENLILQDRAYVAAWLNNLFTMWRYNITNKGDVRDDVWWFANTFQYLKSEIGKTFPVQLGFDIPVAPGLIRSTSDFSDFLQLPQKGLNFSDSKSGPPLQFVNLFNVTKDTFDQIPGYCTWFDTANPGNISTIAMSCSMVYGTAQPAQNSDNVGRSGLTYDLGTEWSIPLYTCATAVKAGIKTVDFKLNGTGLNDISIEDIKDKTYNSTEAKPVWAVESTNMKLDDGVPLWGLADPAAAKPTNVTTLDREYLWLPGIVDKGAASAISVENMPASDFPVVALAYTSQISKSQSSEVVGLNLAILNDPYALADYSGLTNAAMFTKWRELSAGANGTAEILNRVWTDTAANAVVGTKGLAGSRTQSNADLAKRAETSTTSGAKTQRVTHFKRTVRYHWAFAIPAFIVLLFLIVTAVATLVTCMVKRSGFGTMRRTLNATSAGRIMVDLLHPGASPPNAKAHDWIRRAGKAFEVDCSAGHPVSVKDDKASTPNETTSYLHDGSTAYDPHGPISYPSNHTSAQAAPVEKNSVTVWQSDVGTQYTPTEAADPTVRENTGLLR